MTNLFFEKPILNSPYSFPAQHWELDPSGQPTGKTIEAGIAIAQRWAECHRQILLIVPATLPKQCQREPAAPVGALASSRSQKRRELCVAQNRIDQQRDGLIGGIEEQLGHKPGYTLAAGLVFGFDATIQSLVPGYKFDALLRRRDTERYDDRLTVRGNLIDAFDLLMGFVEKHLSDPFYMEGTTSISLRAIIFRELVANIIAHREYTSAAPATMMIYQDRVEFKNPNVPHYHGRIEPGKFTPFPENPTICKFIIQLGRYEELGSGVRRVSQYLPHYAPSAGKPIFEDGDMFTVTVPLAAATEKTAPEVTAQVTACCREEPQSAKAIMAALGVKHWKTFQANYLLPLIEEGILERTIPDKPRSRVQKYRLTEKGRRLASGRKGGTK